MKDALKKPIIIKRYQNRKLYDTQNSTYVTLDEIGAMIRRGEDVRVIDNKNKEDLTGVTLTQIIFEEEKKNKSLLPLQSLKNIIREGGGALKGLLHKTTDTVQNKISTAKEGAENFYDKIEGAFGSTDDNLLKEVLQRTQDISKNIEGKIKTTVDSFTHVASLQNEVRKLRQRVLYLEKKLRHYEK
ncbi:MAG: PHA accumulation regulator DNA-binding protein [uncultured bacterium]|nr:MAG: PHA accumulation regulator DNA-binding protein [uncultured bacterium]HLD45291.1 polyhydroxyalkanoate synthesis regulator DNA-binding domain-containing protein [bacterium]